MIMRSAGSLCRAPGNSTDFRAILLLTGTKLRNGRASEAATQSPTLIVSCSLPRETKMATSQVLMAEIKMFLSVTASSMMPFAVSERNAGLLTHQIHACVSKTIIEAPSNLPVQPVLWDRHTSERNYVESSYDPQDRRYRECTSAP